MEYIEARSSSIEVGVSAAIEMIRKVLLDEYRVTYEPHELEQAMRRGWLVIDGKKEKLNGLASAHLDPIARSIEAQAIYAPNAASTVSTSAPISSWWPPMPHG